MLLPRVLPIVNLCAQLNTTNASCACSLLPNASDYGGGVGTEEVWMLKYNWKYTEPDKYSIVGAIFFGYCTFLLTKA